MLLFILGVVTSAIYESHGAPTCEVLVHFQQKTARCNALDLNHLPSNMASDIKVLSFAENKVTTLTENYFQSYIYLQEIYMTESGISSMSPDTFRGLTNLQLLDLEDNLLEEVPFRAFRFISTVRSISFKDNKLTRLKRNFFQFLPNLETVSFENCLIEQIHPLLFQELTHLKEINLVNNELTTLDAQMGQSLPPNLSVLRLYRNPWNCDCRLRWLRQWIDTTEVNWDFSRNTPACSSPDIIRGINWKHMKSEQFACASRILANSTTSIEVEPGHNMTINCVVTGDPIPHVTWFKGDRSISPTPNKYTLSTAGENPIHSTLTIWNIMTTDAGDYKCLAKNTLGTSEVTYKLWLLGKELPAGGSTEESGISKESILGIAAGGAIFLLACVFCVVYGVRKHDRRKHAYKVRDYKKTNKDKRFSDKENALADKGQLSVMTGLLSDNRELSKNAQNDTKISPENNYQMQTFTYQEKESKKGTETHVPENNMSETDPLCDCAQTKVPNEKKENTPDLLQNDYQSPSKLHKPSKPNGTTIQCEPDNQSNDSDYSSNDARPVYTDRPSQRHVKVSPKPNRACDINGRRHEGGGRRTLPTTPPPPATTSGVPLAQRDRPPDRYMTLPARSHKSEQPVPASRTGTLPLNRNKDNDMRSYSTSPAKKGKSCPAPPPSPEACYTKIPTVKFAEPEYRTINPDPRSIVVPAIGSRQPLPGALSPASSSLSSPSSRGSMSPNGPKKPPRSFAATMEYLADSAEKLAQRRENDSRLMPKPGEKDEFGTCV